MAEALKLEECGIDSTKTFESVLLSSGSKGLTGLIEAAQELEIGESDQFLNVVSRYLSNISEIDNKEFKDWVQKSEEQFLKSDEPTKAQKNFVQTMYIKKITDMITNEENGEEDLKQLKAKLNELKDAKPTELCTSVMQALVMALFLKDLKKSTDVTLLALDMLKNSKDFPKALRHDLFCLVGRHVLDMVNPPKEENLNVDQSINLIMQSDLLSGGLQTHLYGYFTQESLEQMASDAELSNNETLLEHV